MEEAHIESDGKNIYMCFHCSFMLCARCMQLHFGKISIEEGNFAVEIGDQVLKLPPSYGESCALHSQPPPSYDLCTAV